MSTPHRAGLSTASGTPATWLSQPPPRLGGPRRPSRLPDSACSLLQSRRQDERYGAERGAAADGCKKRLSSSFSFPHQATPLGSEHPVGSRGAQRSAQERTGELHERHKGARQRHPAHQQTARTIEPAIEAFDDLAARALYGITGSGSQPLLAARVQMLGVAALTHLCLDRIGL